MNGNFEKAHGIGVELPSKHVSSWVGNYRWLLLPVILLVIGCGSQFGASGDWGGVVAHEDSLYATTQKNGIIELDTDTGLAGRSFDGADPEEGLGPIYSVPVIGDGLLFLATYNGKIHALDLKSPDFGGSMGRWSVDTAVLSETSSRIVGGLAYDQGKLIFGSTDGNVYALDGETGSMVWKFSTEGMIWGTPAIFEGVCYIGSMDHNLYALDIRTGTEKWRYEAEGAIVMAPAVVDDRVLFGALDHQFYALDKTDGAVRWIFSGNGNWFWASPKVAGGVVYAASVDGLVYALTLKDGSQRWKFDVESSVVVAPVITDKAVIVGSDSGKVWFLDRVSGGKTFEPGYAPMGDKVRSAMAMAKGAVFGATVDNQVWAIDPERGQRRWTYDVVDE